MNKTEVTNALLVQYLNILNLQRNCGEDDAVAQNALLVVSNITSTLECDEAVGNALYKHFKTKPTEVQKKNVRSLNWYFTTKIRNIIENKIYKIL